MKTLEQCIELAASLENSAIQTFASQTKTLFEIIGPEAVQFVKEKAEIQHKLKALYDEQEKLYAELGQKQGSLKSYLLFFQQKVLINNGDLGYLGVVRFHSS